MQLEFLSKTDQGMQGKPVGRCAIALVDDNLNYGIFGKLKAGRSLVVVAA
jgi:hypothetical protein